MPFDEKKNVDNSKEKFQKIETGHQENRDQPTPGQKNSNEISSSESNYTCPNCGQAIEETPYCMFCGAKQKGSRLYHDRTSPQGPWHGDDAESLARIPFSRNVEQKIATKSKWMKFVSYAHYFVGAVLGIGVLLGLVTEETVIRMICLIIAGILIYEGRVLWKASDYFRLVAVTDEADQVYVAEGSDQLKAFFLLDSVFYGVILILLFFLGRLGNG